MDRYTVIGVDYEVDLSFEFAIHYIKDKLNKTTALFYLIRCAFAHGCFSLYEENERYFVFENFHNNKSKGRAVLKESTLFKLRDLVNESTEELKNRRYK